MGFPRQEYWSGLSFPSPGDLPNPGIKNASPAWAGGFFTAEPPGKSPRSTFELIYRTEVKHRCRKQGRGSIGRLGLTCAYTIYTIDDQEGAMLQRGELYSVLRNGLSEKNKRGYTTKRTQEDVRLQPTSPSPGADQTPDSSVFFPKGSLWSCWRGSLNTPPLSLSWIHSGSTHKTEQAHGCSSVTSLLTSVHTQNRSQGNKGLQRRKETEIDWTISILTGPSKEHLWLLHASNLQLHPQPMTLGDHTPGIWNLEVPWRT